MSRRTGSRSRPDSDRTGAGFLKRDSGAYTVFSVIGFAMLMVVAGLVIDIGRLMSIHSQASSYADRVALAAAAELDGNPGALNRALAAATAIPTGKRLTLRGDDGDVGFRRMIFMSEINQDPENPYARSPLRQEERFVTREWSNGRFRGGVGRTRADHLSKYVIVETTREREGYLFVNLFGAGQPNQASSGAMSPQAIAGFREDMCNSAPVMVCNPNENSTAGRPRVGQQASFNLQSDFRWRTSNYGLLDADVDASVLGIPISLRLSRLLGRTDPQTACYGDTVRGRGLLGLQLDLGLDTDLLRTSIRAGLNQRYDDNNREFPVALVNCRENRFQLLTGLDVPVEAYARVRMTDRIDVGADLRLRIQFLDPAGPGPSQQKLRRYPVLAR